MTAARSGATVPHLFALLLAALVSGAHMLDAQEHGDHDREARRGRPAASGGVPEPCSTRDGGPGKLRVGAGGGYTTVQRALEAAGAGDTVVVEAGVYRERPEVACPVTLLGREGAVLDGGGEGTVLRLHGPGVAVRGFVIRGSGRDVSREDAGILAEDASDLVVEDNRLLDVLFGIHLKESPGARIRRNEVEGKPLPVNTRGDAIRLWYSARGLIEENVVRQGRDVVIWFSDSVRVNRNDIAHGRYGLHYMYSDHNRFEGNRFHANLVGAFLMYSSDLRFRHNVFSASSGASGMGLGLKDADRIDARENLFLDNIVGIYLDNSPRSTGSENRFERNRFLGNDVAVRILPSSRGNRFLANDFVDNAREVEVPGRAPATANAWRGNHWARYAGFDADDDGVGEIPFVLSRLSDHLISSNPRLALFTFSPGAETLDVLARVLPFLEPRPVAVDSAPRIRPVALKAGSGARRAASSPGARAREGPFPGSSELGEGWWVWLLTAVLGSAAWAAVRLRTFADGRVR